MKTKTFPLILALLLGLFLLAAAAYAKDDDTPAYFRRPLRVQTTAGKQPGITDFARAFVSADQEKYALFSATLARIDGRQLKLPQDEHFTCLIDRPHGYLHAVYTIEGIKDPHQVLEVCYWRTDTDHRLVAVCYYNDLGTELLIFYDYSPATGLMTPLAKPPFQDFHEFLRELIVQLPREGKDIHMKRCWDGGPPPLTLRWDGHGTFTTVGAAERYRQPAAGTCKNCQFPATFKTRFGKSDIYPDFFKSIGKSDEPIPLYNGPGGSAIRQIRPKNTCYDITVEKVQTGRAYINYAAMSEDPSLEPSYDHAWVDCSSLYVLLHSKHDNVAMTLFAEPTRTSRPIQTIKNEYVDTSRIRPFPWQLLEVREGWLKVRHPHTNVTGWIESRFADSDFVQ